MICYIELLMVLLIVFSKYLSEQEREKLRNIKNDVKKKEESK